MVAALVELFRSFAAEEAQHAATGWHDRRRQVVTPIALRCALYDWSQNHFRLGAPPTCPRCQPQTLQLPLSPAASAAPNAPQAHTAIDLAACRHSGLETCHRSRPGDAVQTGCGRCAGEMSDAAEVLSALYDSLELVADGGRLIECLFQWQVHQFVECLSCGKRSHDTQYAQFFYHTFATALRLERAVDLEEEVDPASLGTLLARVEAQAQKSCDTDRGRLPSPRDCAPPRGLACPVSVAPSSWLTTVTPTVPACRWLRQPQPRAAQPAEGQLPGARVHPAAGLGEGAGEQRRHRGHTGHHFGGNSHRRCLQLRLLLPMPGWAASNLGVE